MIYQERIRLSRVALALSIALAGAPSFAQNTTSAVAGRVTTVDGKPAAGATVSIVHAESGSVNNVTTDAEGRYSARGLRVGGPYTIIVNKDGVIEKTENVYLNIAETAEVDATLGKSQMQTVTVTGSAARAEIFSKSNMGSVTNINRATLESQASINRNLQDFARLDPRVSQTDKERGEMSVAGQNSRFNSMTIDGVNVSDTFGLEANGSPTARQPIALEAIQSVQINVANYDVTQKGYTGANINAVTKSGTNTWHGGAYYNSRDDRLVGKRYNVAADTYTDAPPFTENTKGLWFSGPIIKDKLYFFVLNEEFKSSRSAPDFGPIGGGAGTTVGIAPSTISSAQAIAKSKYGMDIGTTDVPTGTYMKSHEQMLKVDWNINENHRANVRYSKTDQTEPIFPSISATGVTLNSEFYNQNKSIETYLGQIFSDWTPNFSTEFKASTRDYSSVPLNNARLPAMSLQITGPLAAGAPSGTPTGSRFLNFGTELSRQRNILGTKTVDMYLGANWTLGDHEIKFGGDMVNNKIYNAFLQNVYGNYTFACDNNFSYTFGSINCSTATSAQIEQAVLENFSRGRPTSYTVQVAAPGFSLNDAVADFSVRDTGLFAQDTFSPIKNLTLNYGLRVDNTNMGNRPVANTAAAAPVIPGVVATMTPQGGGFGFDNSRVIKNAKLWQPRFGFNYKFDTARATQIRGGFGLFQGAAMTVWMANPYSNPGVATRIITCSSSTVRCPTTDGLFSPNPDAQNTPTGSVPKANVDYLAPDLKQPSVWKANLAFENELPWYGLVFGAEYLATKNKDALYYENLNLGAPTATGLDGRPLYYNANGLSAACYSYSNGSVSVVKGCTTTQKALSNPNYNTVMMAKNSHAGQGGALTVSLTMPTRQGFNWSIAGTHTNATEVSPLTSSVSSSNYNARSVYAPNESNAANSSYLVKNRINAMLNWEHKFFSGNYKTRIGLFYEGRSGKPFSWTFKNDMNGDGISGNDLMYIPKAFGSGEVVFAGDTATDHTNEQRFWSIVNANQVLRKAVGGVVGRNTDFGPWTNSIDLKISQELPGFYSGHKANLSLSIMNLGNLLNKKWGHIMEVPFASAGGNPRGFTDFLGTDAQGRYVYGVRSAVDSLAIRQVKGESQWAVQGMIKYEF